MVFAVRMKCCQVAVYTFLEELTGCKAPSDQAKALSCQAAEHQYAGET
jgi:hypothetical protein